MKRFKNILFLADRDKGLSASLDRAVDIANANGARLTVMDVTAEIGIADYIQRTYSLDLNAQLREQRMQFLETLTQRYTDRDIPVYTRVASDPFDDESGNLQRSILDLATSLSEREHATLDLMHAWEMPGESMLANGRARIPRTELHLLLEATETSHRESLDALLSPYGLSTGSSNVHLLKGQPAQTISAYAREREHDIIVTGTLGRAGIAGLFIGNTAEDVLREAQTAVLTVKPKSFVTPIA